MFTGRQRCRARGRGYYQLSTALRNRHVAGALPTWRQMSPSPGAKNDPNCICDCGGDVNSHRRVRSFVGRSDCAATGRRRARGGCRRSHRSLVRLALPSLALASLAPLQSLALLVIARRPPFRAALPLQKQSTAAAWRPAGAAIFRLAPPEAGGFRPSLRVTMLGATGSENTRAEAVVLNRTDRSPSMPGEAEVKYLDGDFRVVRPGAFVRCAVTGVAIPSRSCGTGVSICRSLTRRRRWCCNVMPPTTRANHSGGVRAGLKTPSTIA